MPTEEERERIRQAYYLDHQRVAQIARDTGHCRQTVQRAIDASPRKPSQRRAMEKQEQQRNTKEVG